MNEQERLKQILSAQEQLLSDRQQQLQQQHMDHQNRLLHFQQNGRFPSDGGSSVFLNTQVETHHPSSYAEGFCSVNQQKYAGNMATQQSNDCEAEAFVTQLYRKDMVRGNLPYKDGIHGSSQSDFRLGSYESVPTSQEFVNGDLIRHQTYANIPVKVNNIHPVEHWSDVQNIPRTMQTGQDYTDQNKQSHMLPSGVIPQRFIERPVLAPRDMNSERKDSHMTEDMMKEIQALQQFLPKQTPKHKGTISSSKYYQNII